MKKCRFCAEEIQDEAVKCRFCGEFLEETGRAEPKGKWYYSTSAVVFGLLVIGPLALPLVLRNPRYHVITKVIITIVVIGATVWLTYLVGQMYQRLLEEVSGLGIGGR